MKRRVEIIEENGVKLGRLALTQGDVISLDADIAQVLLDAGWAKCAKTGESSERKPGNQPITVANVAQKLQAL